jgi:ribosomal protein L3 glutamine methyltransferase
MKAKESEDKDDDEKEVMSPAELEEQRWKEMTKASKTVRDAIRIAISTFRQHPLFYGQGHSDAYGDASALILASLRLDPRDQATASLLDCRLTKSERSMLMERIKKRCMDRMPTAYITNYSSFGQFEFFVDQRVVIPRSLIAELLADNAEGLKPHLATPVEDVRRVLDLCTGSGALAVMAAVAFPNAHVDAVDVSPDALKVAAKNVEIYGLEDRIKLHESNMFANVPNVAYDVIISNPPYVPSDVVAELPAEFKHEPKLAFDAGKDGFKFISEILKKAPGLLTDKGSLVVESGITPTLLKQKFPTANFVWPDLSTGESEVFIFRKDSKASDSAKPPAAAKKTAKPQKKAIKSE